MIGAKTLLDLELGDQSTVGGFNRCGEGRCPGFGANPERMCPAEVAAYAVKQAHRVSDYTPTEANPLLGEEGVIQLKDSLRYELLQMATWAGKIAERCSFPEDRIVGTVFETRFLTELLGTAITTFEGASEAKLSVAEGASFT